VFFSWAPNGFKGWVSAAIFGKEEQMSGGRLASRIGSARRSQSGRSGFTLIELIITLVIALLLSLVALPLITNIYRSFQLNAAVSAVTGAIQGTRYQAISGGYPFQVVFSKANSNYQVQSDPNRTGVFTNVTANPVPLGNAFVLGQDTTLQFHPGGLVTASVGSTTLTLTSHEKTESIAVSSYGNIKVTP